ncbi:DUF3445 domain-containing protein, partial [Arthrobacter deserti]|nr:DUF3445 domain-containing protein [Arthrobacter deserti]
ADMDLGENFTLRVELQHLVRLPESNAIMFLIHTHFATLNQIAMVPGWACQFANVLESAPDEMLSYKSFIKIKEPLITWLRAHQDDAAQGRLRRGPGPLPGS